MIKVLGRPRSIIRDKDEVETSYGYEMNERQIKFWANFNDEGKVRRVEIGLATE